MEGYWRYVKNSESVCQLTPLQRQKNAAKQEMDKEFSACDESTLTDVSPNDYDPCGDTEITAKPEETFASPGEKRSLKKTMKEKKSQEKAFRNQQKFVVAVSQAHVDRVAKVIHGAHYNVDKIGGHPGTQEKDIDAIFKRNDAFNAAIGAHRLWLKDQVRGSRARNGKQGKNAQEKQCSEDMENGMVVEKQDLDQLVSQILAGLGLHDHGGSARSSRTSIEDATPSRNRKQRASLLLKLREEIAADIEKSENERRARQQRMEGYWRYVNGTVTDRLANNAQTVDRATGVKLKGDDSRSGLLETLNVDQAEELDPETLADGCEEEVGSERS